ncbi:hypothetical protein GIY62_20290 [Burkholderia plantarii]|uniref:Uncharacterized protein n=1 Tax=Burkholderia plantarii TaxID=41899 RepID=A0A0B6S1F1_BURPL|nr:hypothetical protein [Burkholderia plantarii]AJK49478.1 hypothetical protein BGL_2c14110 [Burkholderia plantarii]WLE62733.1 hypothetical protein GIY62_20290 [Burkholderia plantarii]
MQPKRDKATQQFLDNHVEFLKQHTMTADFAKALRDNYEIKTNPNLQRQLLPDKIEALRKKGSTQTTEPVSEQEQRKNISVEAGRVLANSGLKTHFFDVMPDADRENVYNLTPDVQAYRRKYLDKAKQYKDIDNLSAKRKNKLKALGEIFDSFAMMHVPDDPQQAESTSMQSGYFPYKTELDSNAKGVGVTELYSKTKNASGRWVFTGQMNGCAIAVENIMDQRMASADNVNRDAKAHHFPSPASNFERLKNWGERGKLSSWFGVNGYSSEVQGDAYDGFNALLVKGADVHVVSQKQVRDMRTQTTKATGEVDVFKAGRARLVPEDGFLRSQPETADVFGMTREEHHMPAPVRPAPVKESSLATRIFSTLFGKGEKK